MITGADLLCRVLEEHGVTCVFGVPGTQTILLHEALRRSRIRVVLATHELAASFMANGYYRASGRVAPLVTIPGPGFTYALTGLAEALHDSAAVLHIVGRTPGTDHRQHFQALDQRAIAGPLVKEAFVASTPPTEIPAVVAEALECALGGEPGPVLLEWTAEALSRRVAPLRRREPTARRGPRRRHRGARRRAPRVGAPAAAAGGAGLRRRVRAAAGARRAAVGSGRDDRLRARGARRGPSAGPRLRLRARHRRRRRTSSSGKRLDPRRRLQARGGRDGGLPPRAPARSARPRGHQPAALLGTTIGQALGEIVATAEAFLAAVTPAVRAPACGPAAPPGRRPRWRSGGGGSGRGSASPSPRCTGRDPPPPRRSSRPCAPPCRATASSSPTRGSTRRCFVATSTSSRVGGFSSRAISSRWASGCPAAIGARLAAPTRPVVAVIGDGGFAMSGLELLTAVREKIPLTVVVFVDGSAEPHPTGAARSLRPFRGRRPPEPRLRRSSPTPWARATPGATATPRPCSVARSAPEG